MLVAVCFVVLAVIALCFVGIRARTQSQIYTNTCTIRDEFGSDEYYMRGDGVWTTSLMAGATPQRAGMTGMVPTPAVGAQNSYLRGDGTWQQANNAPTAAICMHVAYIAGRDFRIQTPTAGVAFPFNTVMFSTGTSGVITPSPSATNITTFNLAAGNTYKCVAQMGYNIDGGDFIYQWSTVPYVVGTTTLFGVVGDLASATPRGNTAIGYITVTTPITISLIVTSPGNIPSCISPGTLNNYPWATIEVVSNNNTIMPFVGATGTSPGMQGYMPAPPAGTQNSYLRGDGSWQPTTFPGQITWSASPVAPAGWLVCDGKSYLVAVYPGLFAAISTLYGVGTDKTGGTTFSVPDMRGQFVRGVDSGAGIDVGRTLGTKQTDTIQNITGAYTGSATIANAGTNGTGAIYTTGDYQGSGGYNGGGNGANYQRILMDASRSVRTSKETRPTNIALVALIKT